MVFMQAIAVHMRVLLYFQPTVDNQQDTFPPLSSVLLLARKEQSHKCLLWADDPEPFGRSYLIIQS